MEVVTRVATLLALVATLAAPALARAEAAPCVASGLVAVVQPDATAPLTLGPAVSAATKAGTPVASFQDTQYAVDLTDAAAGAAGCVGAGAPGGTHAVSGAWSVLGGVLRGSALTADLVPAGGDGSGWRLRTKLAGLEVAGAPTKARAGATVAVADWGTLTVDAQVDLPRLAPLRSWAAALSLRLSKPHAGLPAGTLVLVGYAAATRAPAPPPVPPTPAATTTTAPTTTAPPPPPARSSASGSPPAAPDRPSSGGRRRRARARARATTPADRRAPDAWPCAHTARPRSVCRSRRRTWR